MATSAWPWTSPSTVGCQCLRGSHETSAELLSSSSPWMLSLHVGKQSHSPCVMKKQLVLVPWASIYSGHSCSREKRWRKELFPEFVILKPFFSQNSLGAFCALQLLLGEREQIKMIKHRAILKAEAGLPLSPAVTDHSECSFSATGCTVTFEPCLPGVTRHLLFGYYWDL